MNVLDGGQSAVLSIPKLTKEQLQSETFLRKEVQKLNQQADRNRRRESAELRRSIKQAEINLVHQKSLVPPSESNTHPRVLAAKRSLKQAQSDLDAFKAGGSTKGYLRMLMNSRQGSRRAYREASRIITEKWEGPPPPQRDANSLWSRELGGIIDKSHIHLRRVHHSRHWDKTPHTRGLCRPQHLDDRVPVTMTTPLRERLQRSAFLVDSSPSIFHASDEYVNDLSIKPTKKQKLQESQFKINHMIGDTIHMCSVDHPKHGIPFHHQQRIRTYLDRSIENLELELKNFPKYGLTLKQGEPRAAVEQALGEMKRIRKGITGERATKLEHRVAEAKQHIKTKLKMLSGLKSKGFGNLSFLKAIQTEVTEKTTPRPD